MYLFAPLKMRQKTLWNTKQWPQRFETQKGSKRNLNECNTYIHNTFSCLSMFCKKWLELWWLICGWVVLNFVLFLFSARVAAAVVCKKKKRREEGASTAGRWCQRQHLLLWWRGRWRGRSGTSRRRLEPVSLRWESKTFPFICLSLTVLLTFYISRRKQVMAPSRQVLFEWKHVFIFTDRFSGVKYSGSCITSAAQ